MSQRAREISIRLALGADVGSVRGMVLKQGVKLIVIGSALGLAGGYGMGRMVASIVEGLSPVDPITVIGVPLILGVVALLANYAPARRATRMDPMTVLRME